MKRVFTRELVAALLGENKQGYAGGLIAGDHCELLTSWADSSAQGCVQHHMGQKAELYVQRRPALAQLHCWVDPDSSAYSGLQIRIMTKI